MLTCATSGRVDLYSLTAIWDGPAGVHTVDDINIVGMNSSTESKVILPCIHTRRDGYP
jgi:hypothetical protein